MSNLDYLLGITWKIKIVQERIKIRLSKTRTKMANNTESNDTYFDIEGLMIDYGITGESIVRKIMSQLDLKSLGVSLRISKTFYRFLDKEQGLWIRHLKGAIKDVKKMRKFLSNEIFEQWLKLAELIESNGNAADVISFIPRFYDSYKHRQDGISFKQVSYAYFSYVLLEVHHQRKSFYLCLLIRM